MLRLAGSWLKIYGFRLGARGSKQNGDTCIVCHPKTQYPLSATKTGARMTSWHWARCRVMLKPSHPRSCRSRLEDAPAQL